MRKMNLQHFAETVKGSKLIYLYRVLSTASAKAAQAISFTTENSRSVSKDADTTATKDGPVRTPGEAEIEVSVTSMLAKGDTLIDELETAMLDNSKMEVWEVNLEEPASPGGQNKYKGVYYQGYITSLEKTSASDGFVEISITFGLEGTGSKGDVTVTQEQQEVAAYVFTDTTVQTED